MQKNRIVMLLGAGAATPWEGKLTLELTSYIIQKFKIRNQSGKNFLQFLQEYYAESFNKNKKINIQPEEVHFEILLSIVEYLTEYYENINQTPFITLRPEWIEFFEINQNFYIELPKIIITNEGYSNNLIEFTFKNNAHLKLRTTRGFEYNRFFNCIHNEIIDIIKMHVTEYNKNLLPSTKMNDFLNILSQQNLLRIYSTNYDNIISELNLDIPVFNGFEKVIQEEEFDSYFGLKIKEKSLECNLLKILFDLDINCFYSIHGNINFKAMPYFGKNKSISPIVFIPNRDSDFFDHHDDASQVKVAKNIIQNYTIISGQRKIINTYLEPYKSFFNVFQRDCFLADTIICIGTSFMDHHLQKQIYNAIYHFRNDSEKKLKIIIITKMEIVDCSELGATKNILELLLKNESHEEFIFPYFYNMNKKHWYESNNTGSVPPYVCEVKFKIYSNGFEKFLDDKTNWEEILN